MISRLVFGFHPILARLRSDPESVLEVYIDSERHDARTENLIECAKTLNIRVLRLSRERLDHLAKNGRHQGAVSRIKSRPMHNNLENLLDEIDSAPLILVLDGITDPHNLGACLRVADAAGVHAVVAPKDGATGITAIVSKVASGAAEAVPFFMVTNLARTLQDLKERDIWIVGTDGTANQSIYDLDIPKSVAWVMGAEGKGMRRLTRERCDFLVNIPMRGIVESLNVSVASGICLFETIRQHKCVAL